MTSQQEKKLTPFQQKALDYTKHISLTANAGSGKTFVLKKRFVEIAIQPGINLRNIVAITFTEKAASELYKNISEEIESRILTEKVPEIKSKLISLRKYLVSANISTIHSFCLNILREYAPQAGIDAAFIPLDSAAASELIDLSIEELFHMIDVDASVGGKLKKVIRILGSRKNTAKELRNLIHSRYTANEILDLLNSHNNESLAKYYRDYCTASLAEIIDFNFEKIISTIQLINNEVKKIQPENKYVAPADDFASKFDKKKDLIEQLRYFQSNPNFLTATYSLRKDWTKRVEDKFSAEINYLEEKFAQIKELFFDDEADEAAENLASFNFLVKDIYELLLEIYSQKKRDRSSLDFEDMLLIARDLLNREEVKNELAEKYHYIMIDEYQDTNELQYKIMMPILRNLETGNLFVVGDEKQSIYRFRGAEPEIFETTKSDIGSKSSTDSILTLPHSFRMAPNIAAFVNSVFSKLFERRNNTFNEIPYVELICGRDENEGGKVEFLISEDEKIEETDLVVSRIQKLHEERDDFNYGDIAVLCRKRKWFESLSKSFSECGIPFTIVGGKGFYNQPIIFDITNYLAFLINPSNDFALAVILRSPFFSISDIALYEISRLEEKTFFEKLKAYSILNKKHDLIEILENHLSFAKTLDLPKLIRKILKDTGYISVVAAKNNSEQDLANIEKLIGLASEKSAKGFSNLYDFVDFLATASEREEEEGQAAIDLSDNSVRIMTVHQSKGLEFDTVILFNSHDKAKSDRLASKSISMDKKSGFLTKLPVEGNFFGDFKKSYIGTLYDYIERRKQSAEIKRLFYVAATRAVNHLIISGQKKKTNFDRDSFLGFCESVFGKESFTESENIEVYFNQEFMTLKETEFIRFNKEIQCKIPIVKNVFETTEVEDEESKVNSDDLEIETNEITDKEENEIISATKIATFTQCPVKYQLTYELGYGKLLNLLQRDDDRFDFNNSEDSEEKLNPNVKGSIIHKILEEENIEDLQKSIRTAVAAESGLSNSNLISQKETDKIEVSIKRFLQSELWRYIRSFPTYFKEYEIYSKHKDYFLYGIIDRLIIDEDKILIVDYKSDSFHPSEAVEKGTHYLPQLMFYALVVSKQFKEIKKYELRLAFIEQPQIEFKKNIGIKDLVSFEKEIEKIIAEIRDKNFIPNFEHCGKCHYSPDRKNCVKKF